VTWLFKHCPLHGNGSINKGSIARQRLVNTSTPQELLEAVFSIWYGRGHIARASE
jgi:hypothetical protein